MRPRGPTLFVTAVLAACGGNGSPDPPPSSDPATTAIFDIQGSGTASPLVGQAVTVDGVVTGDFQDNDGDTGRNLGGFFLQSVPDADLATSDGIFVFDGNDPTTDVTVGDAVRVTGVVTEHFGETQIAASDVTVRGVGTIQAISINLPLDATTTNSDGELIADFERYEGMLVRFPQPLTVTSLVNLERFGEVGLAQGDRPYQFTNRNAPDVAAYDAHRRALAARSLLLDDGRRAANVTPVTFLTAGAASDYSIRSGDQATGLTGTLRFSRGSGAQGSEAWRLVPTVDPQFDSRNPRTSAPAARGALRVVSLNTLNFFSTIDDGRRICGPAADSNCRGADSTAERDRQLAKLVTTLLLSGADIAGLIEIENNGGAALQMITAALNAAGNDRFDFVATGMIGDDTIATGFVYNTATVSLRGASVILDGSIDTRFNDERNRPALAQSFQQVSNGAVLSIVVTHLKSKGSPCDEDGDPNVGDGQGNCNATRTAAAAALADWIALDPAGSGDPDYLLIGDLNAYLFEDPLTALENAGLVNLVETASGSDAYSFVFDGQAGALDHAMATNSLASQVADVTEWHINADEPPLLDYNLESARDPALFDADSPFRASDHDPVVIGLNLNP